MQLWSNLGQNLDAKTFQGLQNKHKNQNSRYLAGAAPLFSQKETQDMTTMRLEGMYTYSIMFNINLLWQVDNSTPYLDLLDVQCSHVQDVFCALNWP
jgi:hypothetical protein